MTLQPITILISFIVLFTSVSMTSIKLVVVPTKSTYIMGLLTVIGIVIYGIVLIELV